MPNRLDGFTLDRTALRTIGHDLQRPECILAEPDGTLWAADARGTVAPWIASITFGGADLRTADIGNLMGTTIPYFRSPVAGLPMLHWT